MAQPLLEQQGRTHLNGLIYGNYSTTDRLQAATVSAELSFVSGLLKLAQQSATSGQVLKWNGTAWAPANDATGGSGTVTSVALSAPSEYSVTGSPITGAGTLGLSWANQTAGKVLASPPSSTGAPSFQVITAAFISDFGEGAQDAAGSLIVGSTGISAIYSDASNTLTITNTGDLSSTNEVQNLSLVGQALGISLGGTGVTLPIVNVSAGTGVSVSIASGNATVTNTGDTDGTNDFVQGGNSFATTATLGTNDNNALNIETNNAIRAIFGTGGAMTLGTTALTSGKFNINGFTGFSYGMFIDGGSGLTGPVFYRAQGSGSGSTATALEAVFSMISGNSAITLANSSTTGSGGSVYSTQVESSVTGDPRFSWIVNGGTTWSAAVDNSDADKWEVVQGTAAGTNVALSLLTTSKAGLWTASPNAELDVAGLGGLAFPVGSTADRPATLTRSAIRGNNTIGAVEVYNVAKGGWYPLVTSSTPSVAAGAAAGTSPTIGFVAGAASNDRCGAIAITIGASPTTGTLLTVTYAQAFAGTTARVQLTSCNQQFGSDYGTGKISVGTQSNTSFTITANTALTAGTTLIFNYFTWQ